MIKIASHIIDLIAIVFIIIIVKVLHFKLFHVFYFTSPCSKLDYLNSCYVEALEDFENKFFWFFLLIPLLMFLYVLNIIRFKMKLKLTNLKTYSTKYLIFSGIFKVLTSYGIVYMYSIELFLPGNLIFRLNEYYLIDTLMLITILTYKINFITVFIYKPSLSFNEFLLIKIFNKKISA